MTPARTARSLVVSLAVYLTAAKPAIDSLNGLLLRSGFQGPSLSQAFGFILAILLFLCLSTHSKIHFSIIAGLWTFLVGFAAQQGEAMDYLFRWALNSSFIFLSFLAFREVIKRNFRGFLYCAKIASISYFVFLINLILGYLGFGMHQYNGAIGAVGFLYAGNEMSVALVVSIAILTEFTILSGRFKLFYRIILPISIGAAIVKITKTAMVGTLMVVCLLPLALRRSEFLSNHRRKGIKTSYAIIALVAATPVMVFGAYKLGLPTRLTYWSERLDTVTLIFSHRNIWASEAIAYAYNNFNILNYLFGDGTRWVDMIGHTTEIDPVDFFMTYGVLGLILSYLPFLMALIACTARISPTNPNAPEARFGLLFTVMLIAISATAGHVLNSGTAGALLGISLALGTVRRPHRLIRVNGDPGQPHDSNFEIHNRRIGEAEI